ncbi:MAG: maleylpyruvate isomerase family mycothiol-dependent enzyme [Actinomycetia bacterium]|nr:maleylpyruvate isomerase family mycothiol-dependent enzyme [Actinomycetes bacterium]
MTKAKGSLAELLRLQFKSLDDLGSNLTPREWHASASLPGWVVFDVYAHIIGTESSLEGEDLPDGKLDVASFDHVRNEIGTFNEIWIEALSSLNPQAMMDRFRSITAKRLISLAAMTEEEFEAETSTPVGPAPYWRFMQIRVFDCWMHEQDIREALGRPGHERGPCAEAALDEVERALGYIVGKKVGAIDGASVTFELTGPVERILNVKVADGRAEIVDRLRGQATTTITMTSSLFMRLIGGRTELLTGRLGEMNFLGDLNLAQKLVSNLGFTI